METQALPSMDKPASRPVGPSREEVELRSTALYYASRVIGERGTNTTETQLLIVLRAAKALEGYLITGQVG
jgi:hypothetical protein